MEEIMVIRRILAYLGDLILITIVYIALFFSFGILLFPDFLVHNRLAIILFYCIFVFIYIGYFCLLPLFWNGFTIFKRWLGIQLQIKSQRRFLVFFKLLVKYLFIRFILTIVTFGILGLIESIVIKIRNGQSMADQLLRLETKLL